MMNRTISASIRTQFVIAACLVLAIALPAVAADKPAVTVTDQADKNDTITVAQVVSNGPGWIVIHVDANGPGAVVGYAPVHDGLNNNVVVKIDSYKATPKLYAMLHIDAGKVGTYEFPGPDVPAQSDGMMITPAFMVSDLDPRVQANDQKIVSGTVTIAEVLSSGPGWLVIHSDNKTGGPGPVIGYAAVPDGLTTNLKVKIDPAKATATLYAMLHTDAGKVGTYEFPGADKPVMVDGNMVSPAFKAK